VDKIQSVLVELDVSKGADFDSIPPFILMNCASPNACPLSLLFNRSLSTCVSIDRYKLSYVTLIFKKGRRNNVEDYRGVAILSAISKHFELLVYITMYDKFSKKKSKYKLIATLNHFFFFHFKII
jgi:hypothetical protein